METLNRANGKRAEAALRMVMKFEVLRRFPMRALTGHFMAFRAVRR